VIFPILGAGTAATVVVSPTMPVPVTRIPEAIPDPKPPLRYRVVELVGGTDTIVDGRRNASVSPDCDEVASFDSTSVLVPIEETVVLLATPVPATGIPTRTPGKPPDATLTVSDPLVVVTFETTAEKVMVVDPVLRRRPTW